MSAENIIQYEELTLVRAPYAVRPHDSRGRLYPVSDEHQRTPTQRDRDRVIHCGSFRKLKGKTQVFVDGQGDYYRTRLTHSLEVAQIARSMARTLQLDEDLAEVSALAHDIGHTCFGHVGEHTLHECMKDVGGFDHNEQALRALMVIENPYTDCPGLNLCWETLEGILKHNGPLPHSKRGATIRAFDARFNLQLDHYASLEAQLAAAADDIAYNAHDVDDGHRAGLLPYELIRTLPFYKDVLEGVEQELWHETERARVSFAVRKVINMWMQDVVTNTRANIAKLQPTHADDVRNADFAVADFAPGTWAELKKLKRSLYDNMYKHPRVMTVMDTASIIVRDLFEAITHDPEQLPPDHRHREEIIARSVADFIAGMTDRYAINLHRQLTGKQLLIYGV